MMSETNMTDRISRARAQDMEAHTVSEDPLVVEVENHDSAEGDDSVHTVLPEQLYCGCWDHRARVTCCKHLIFLALGEDESVSEEVRTVVRNAITDELTALQDEEMGLRSRLQEIAEERTQMEVVRQEMPMRDYGLGSSPGASDQDVEEAIEEADIDAEEIVDELEDDDGEDDFRSMVEDLRTE